MPMFYTPKPRQFRYVPRFYDPEKERWEALKQKYADERAAREALDEATNLDAGATDGDSVTEAPVDEGLEYFQRRVRDFDREEKRRSLTLKDLVRKREMPTFNYRPRFADTGEDSQGAGEHIAEFKKRSVNIKRRFDVGDPDYMKPVPAGRIMLYALLVCLLLYWILF